MKTLSDHSVIFALNKLAFRFKMSSERSAERNVAFHIHIWVVDVIVSKKTSRTESSTLVLKLYRVRANSFSAYCHLICCIMNTLLELSVKCQDTE